MKKKTIIGILLAVLLGMATIIAFKKGNSEGEFRTARITGGDIKAAVTATGTVNPVVTVLVGTQISGTVKRIYADFNTPVRTGQLLALIDPAVLEAEVDRARAALRSAEANVRKSEADRREAKRNLERNKVLFTRNLIARSDLDASETKHLTAEAQLSSARAQVAQAKASLGFAATNLKYTQIRSPVDGVVISRNVEVGQTVAANFQTPTLFSIARDLTRMQVDTSVDEADIGKIRTGQPAEFTVDAHQGVTFKGRVLEVRNAPVTVQNVVTYDVVVRVDNREFKLKPGMTANVSIITAVKKGVLRVPSAALRVRLSKRHAGSPPPKTSGVWILADGGPKRVGVETGISDTDHTEIVSGDLTEGQEVIVESAAMKKTAVPVRRGLGH